MSSTKTDILCFLKEFLDPFLFDRNGKSHHQAMEEKKDRWILGALPPSVPLQLYKVKNIFHFALFLPLLLLFLLISVLAQGEVSK